MPAESVNPASPPQPLRVLFVEDNPRDVKLTARMLEQAGYHLEFETADTRQLFREQLAKADPQIIICDYNLRGWTAMDALEIVRELEKDIPVVVVSGSLGDEAVVECIMKGAMDYVLKDRMARLPSAVERALKEKAMRDDRKRAEGTLRESESRKAAILESALDCVVTIDHQGQIIEFNPAAEQTFGYSRAEVLGKLLVETIIPPSLRERHRQGFARYLATGEGTILGKRIEMPALRADGTEFPVELAVSRINLDGPPMFTAYLRDLTERKKLEQQLRQAQKMEAIGQLAGGVAHDFNNLLTIITGYSQLLSERVGVEEPLRAHINEITKAADRAAALTRQLLAFGRRQVLAPQVLDLNAVVASTEKMLRRLISEDIELVTVCREGLGRVRADAGQVEQVIMNLAVNARDAMPRGGKLTIETANVELDEAYAQKHVSVTPGPYVMLAVSDTGHGMDAETQARIFEPFFTTKGQGKGTGLGLATVYGIVKQSGGNIWVYSEPGRGGTFKVYLPRVEEAVTVGEPREAERVVPRGSETVLLVEDEESVRSLVRGVLEGSGYKVLEAQSVGHALEICERYKGPIHVLLTDVVMPQMSGRELAESLRAGHPETKVLYMSGYTDDAIVRHGVLDAGTAFLQKPFTPNGLALKVREALDGPPGAKPSDG